MTVQDRMRQILAAEAAAISAIEINDAYEKALEALFACTGKVVCTGMGKAGLVARKLAVTMSSTGTPSIYLHPGEAAHGDLGVVADGDCIVAFSTSGKTREVIEALELSRHLGSGTIIGVTSHPDSDLRRVSDIVLDMGEVTEPCPLGLTPSASTAVMYAISDALALTLMERKGITKHDYGLRHHGGYLGRMARTDNV
jgi:arabinose-5-phosphate isomerase